MGVGGEQSWGPQVTEMQFREQSEPTVGKDSPSLRLCCHSAILTIPLHKGVTARAASQGEIQLLARPQGLLRLTPAISLAQALVNPSRGVEAVKGVRIWLLLLNLSPSQF